MKNRLAQFKNSKLFNILIVILFMLGILLYGKFAAKNIQNNELKGWNNLIIKNAEIFVTDNWFSYNAKNLFSKFSISFPGDWTINGSVLSNKEGEKIAEFSPGLVQLKPAQNCFDNGWSSGNGESELISQKNIEIGSFKGKLIVEKAIVWIRGSGTLS